MDTFYVLELKKKNQTAMDIYYAGWIDRLNNPNYAPREAVTPHIAYAARWEREEIAYDALRGLPRPEDFEVKEHSY